MQNGQERKYSKKQNERLLNKRMVICIYSYDPVVLSSFQQQNINIECYNLHVKNAQIAWKPSSSIEFQFSVRCPVCSLI